MTDDKQTAHKLHAYIAVHDDGSEGVMGIKLEGRWVQMVVTNEALLQNFRETAKAIAREAGVRVEKRVYTVTASEVVADELKQPSFNTESTH